MIKITCHKGTEANVNSFLLSDDENIIVVDMLRNSAEAEQLADQVKKTNKKLHCIFVTHGHADHYMGLGAFHRHFPKAPIMVATDEIKQDIIQFSQWMESIGWLEGEPHMKVKTDKNPDGFNYSNLIKVLDEPILTLPKGDNEIKVKADYSGSECGHLTTLEIPEQKVFLASDLIYDKVHTWCGPGVGVQEIKNWIQILDELLAQYDNSWTFYAGHGGNGDTTLITSLQDYLRKFLEVTSSATTKQEAIDKMKKLFPCFGQEDFLLVHSVDFHVKE